MTSGYTPEITVLYFAAASTATGLTVERIPLPVPSTSDSTEISLTSASKRTGFPLSALSSLLAARHPHTTLETIISQSSWAVDEEMVDDPNAVFLRGGEEVAIICPVSGG
ncbi:hypothetical protein AcW1_008272 [Taiwanofungus camphoratus]|nr:hypothetical protein AcV5_008567 [Antrodia cinnamomea]KAI0951161.1 hypothetical protein AcW1_008272 [Antrodia cinnamomea]KAI0956048.1 hypothetical protein AcV7_006556 [Antrodia cinnamomea]